MPAAQTGMKLFFSCFKNVAVHGYGLDHLPPGMCVTDAPGPAKVSRVVEQDGADGWTGAGTSPLHLPCISPKPRPYLPSQWHLLIMEPIRLVLLYYAAYLLYSEGGYGGIEEIKVSARARARARVTVTVTVAVAVAVRGRVRVIAALP